MQKTTRFFRRRRVKAVVPGRQVQTKNGIIEGARLIDEGDCQIDAFLGIQYAKSPIGPLRFKRPEPPESWNGVKKVIRFGPRAPQKDFLWTKWTAHVKTNEDCLYLNVFSPTWTPPDDQPSGFAVMVFVHGGGYVVDSSSNYGDISICDNLCRQNVIVVTIQYRLGLLGFFCTGDSECPGNNGLWDQAFALKWIQENIGAFNGDINRITVFGQSAGGASVDLLSISPISRDLFQQVIPMAGNAEAAWAVTDTQRIVNECKRFVKKHGWVDQGKGVENSRKMLEFLRSLPVKAFERGLIGRGGIDMYKTGLDLAPVIDGEFLPKPISELRKDAPRKNCMIGTCEYEGLIFAALNISSYTLRGIDKFLSMYITEEKYPNYEEVRNEAKEFYLKDVDTRNKESVARAYTNLFSDLFVNIATAKYAHKMAELGNTVYLYIFEHYNPKSFGILSLRIPFKAATHCTEIAYIFGVSVTFPYKSNETDAEVKEMTTRLWTNFAKYGDPNGSSGKIANQNFQWLPVSENEPDRYLSIGSGKCDMKQYYCSNRADFWTKYDSK